MKTPQVTPDWKTGIYIGNGQIVSDTTVEDTVENIARMDIQERDTFVKTLVTKWPDLATSVNNMITLEQMVQEKLYEKHLEEQAESFEIQEELLEKFCQYSPRKYLTLLSKHGTMIRNNEKRG